MKKDLRIRPIGKPKIAKDGKAGYNQLQRRFVVEGPKVSKEGITGEGMFQGIPLFLDVGTPDDEFSDYLLVNQSIEPSSESLEKAYLTRTYVEIRGTWSSEKTSTSKDLETIQRTYVVLKQVHEKGYSTEAFSKHPSQTKEQYSSWDYLPNAVIDTEPGEIPFDEWAGASYGHPEFLKNPSVGEYGTPISTALINEGIKNSYVRKSVSLDHTNPGIDVWSVTWVAPAYAYWATATSQKSFSGTDLPSIISFDSDGLKIEDLGSVSSSSSAVQAYQFTFFATAEKLPESFITLLGARGGGSSQPSVYVDVSIDFYEGGVTSEKRLFPNAVWSAANNANIIFPTRDGQLCTVASNRVRDFHFTTQNINPFDPPLYKNQPFLRIGGRINYTSEYSSASFSSSRIGTKIDQIHSYRNIKIWRVSITYVP